MYGAEQGWEWGMTLNRQRGTLAQDARLHKGTLSYAITGIFIWGHLGGG